MIHSAIHGYAKTHALTYSFGNIMTMITTPRHMQGNARSVALRPKRRMTIDVPRRENPNDIVFVTC